MRLRQLFLISSITLFAQQAPEPLTPADPVIKLDVRQVLVPVIVSDKKGHHASGLRASDFRVFEDGVPEEIVAFSTDMATSLEDPGALGMSAPPVVAPTSAHKAPRRTYVFCVDLLHASPSSSVRVRSALESLFHDEKNQDAQYALIGIGRSLQVLQTATTNPLEILLKLRGLPLQGAMAGTDAASLAGQFNNLRIRMEELCKRCACGLRTNQRSCGPEIDSLLQSVDAEAALWVGLNNAVAGQFKTVVEELGKIPTGRTLVLISDGFDLNPKRAFYSIVAEYFPGNSRFHVEDRTEAEGSLRDALKIAADRNVIMYGVDARGGFSPTLASSGAMDASGSGTSRDFQSGIAPARGGQTSLRTTTLNAAPGANGNTPASYGSEAMEQLAHSTGGVYFHGDRDLLKDLREALADGRQYYVLAYVPKNTASDGFRRITVEVSHKDLTVRSKAGYWAGPSAQ